MRQSDEKGYHWVFTDSGYGGHRRRFEFWDEFVSHERHSLLIMMLQAIVNGHEHLQRRLWCALNGPQVRLQPNLSRVKFANSLDYSAHN